MSLYKLSHNSLNKDQLTVQWTDKKNISVITTPKNCLQVSGRD